MRTTRIGAAIISLIFLSGVIADRARAQDPLELKSPRLRALALDVNNGNRNSVGEFWKEMEVRTTPLVEAIEGDESHVLLTVLWRGDEKTRNVLLIGGLARGYPANVALEQLLDTKVWFITYWAGTDLRASYKLSPNDSLKIVPMNDAKAVATQRKNYRRDPLNPKRFGGGSLVELPDAPDEFWMQNNSAVPKGKTQTENKFGSDILGNERSIGVYVPPNYDPSGDPYPMLLVFDKFTYMSVVPTPRILNNLIHAEKIPPVISVFVGNARNARNDELPCNEKFVEFLAAELIPWVRDNYNVSTDPSKNVIAGSSFGGLASSFVAFRHPELFGNVISQSGSYWWSPDTNSSDLAHEVEGEWLTRQYAEADTKPIRFVIETGLNEGGTPSMVIVNRHFRNVLIAKDYEIVKYDEFNGGHEYLNWHGSLAYGLIALIGE